MVSGIELATANEKEILGMGGPWTCDLYIGDKLISEGCILNNFVYHSNLNLLFFVKFNRVSNYQWYFSIHFYNIAAKTIFEFDKVFDKVYLGKFISERELEIYPAFHDRPKNLQQAFDLDKEEFYQV